ncbi:MAG: helix-turn-helix domain-containing protein [Acidaminococcaceae bacterium]|nr:helix-turn-helix domain-containing protein [Acidaminococcaceae bacterium]
MSIILENDCSDKHRRYDEDVLTIREMMDMLAIGKNTAYKLIREGKVKSFRLGNSYKILRKSVEEYIYSH